MEVTEYAVGNKIVSGPFFACWVSAVLKKRDQKIAKVKYKYWHQSHNFFIELPKLVPKAC